MDTADVLVVGTGHGGANTAIALRKLGYRGSIAMVGKDGLAPYERPPLSKDYMAGKKSFSRLLIRPDSFWEDNRISLIRNAEVVEIDANARRVFTRDGRSMAYGDLVWSAGGNSRKLQCTGSQLRSVHEVRDKFDVDRIVADLDRGVRRVAVIGGGYIGLEAAAVLTKMGCQVTLLETQKRVLARVAGPDLARFFESEHREHGVDVRVEADIDYLMERQGSVVGIRLDGGEIVHCSMVVVGIGITPNIKPVADAGAETGNGLVVDQNYRTSLPHIYAIGDCAAHQNRFANMHRIRLESVQNAHDMALAVAQNICGQRASYSSAPWFWSNQYDLKLQTVGLTQGHDAAVIRGDPAERSFSVIYLRRGKVIALDCVNSVKDFVQGRKLVEAGVSVPTDALGDLDQPLRSFLP